MSWKSIASAVLAFINPDSDSPADVATRLHFDALGRAAALVGHFELSPVAAKLWADMQSVAFDLVEQKYLAALVIVLQDMRDAATVAAQAQPVPAAPVAAVEQPAPVEAVEQPAPEVEGAAS